MLLMEPVGIDWLAEAQPQSVDRFRLAAAGRRLWRTPYHRRAKTPEIMRRINLQLIDFKVFFPLGKLNI